MNKKKNKTLVMLLFSPKAEHSEILFNKDVNLLSYTRIKQLEIREVQVSV